MSIATAKPRLTIAMLALVGALVGSLWVSIARSEAARVTCPGTFTVLHNDMIGKLSLPAGQYTITVVDDQKITCPRASSRFTQFLQDYDGVLPSPWTYRAVAVGDGKFFHRTNKQIGFRVKRTAAPTPTPTPTTKYQRCPGTFTVKHNDRIGSLNLPRGKYYIYSSTSPALACATAESLFAQFLQRPAGNLPSPWRLKGSTFKNPNGTGFRVKQAF